MIESGRAAARYDVTRTVGLLSYTKARLAAGLRRPGPGGWIRTSISPMDSWPLCQLSYPGVVVPGSRKVHATTRCPEGTRQGRLGTRNIACAIGVSGPTCRRPVGAGGRRRKRRGEER